MPEKMPKKSKISAVICELNPLHLGHRALFRQAKQVSEGIVCILSGNFIQRGEPAVLDKWARCQLALENGADLVLELPLPWACAGAERFAAGGVRLAAALGNVDFLIFGSENPDISAIKKIAEALLSSEFSARLSAFPDAGETFARRREAVLADMLGPEVLPFLRSPNSILGIEYTKALLREHAPITPLAFPRLGAGHDQTANAEEFRSAGELRELLRAGKGLDGLAPESTVSLLGELTAQGKCPADLRYLERAVLCKLRSMDASGFAALPDVSEGLENRLTSAARQAGSLEEFFALAKSKRYTLARLRRLALYAFLGVTKDLPASPPYLRVLGMNSVGAYIMREAGSAIPPVSRPADVRKLGGDALRIFELEARADDLYALACPSPQPCGRDYTEKIQKM